jgi:predicted nucleic acid-binding protein
MMEAIIDTGPFLHLNEINYLLALDVFEQFRLPDLVDNELRTYHVNTNQLNINAKILISSVEHEACLNTIQQLGQPQLHLADAAVFIMAQNAHFSLPVLTDDLALRRQLEAHGTLVVGSVDILIRAYCQQLISKIQLENAIDLLFDESSLHLSPAFRVYVRH